MYVVFGTLTAEAGRSCSFLLMSVLTGECEVFCSVSAQALFVLLLLYCSLIYCTLFPRESMIHVRLYLLRALRSAQQEVRVCFQCCYLLYYIINYLLLILFSVKLIIPLLGKLLLSFALYILTIYHKAPTNQDLIAQRTEDEMNASPRIDTQEYLVGRWRHPRAQCTFVFVILVILFFVYIFILNSVSDLESNSSA